MSAMSKVGATEYDAAVDFRNTLIRIIRKTLGLPELVAVPMADVLARGFSAELGGLYVTKREIRASRNAAVLRDFNGRNHVEVMHRYGISRRTLYRVIGGK